MEANGTQDNDVGTLTIFIETFQRTDISKIVDNLARKIEKIKADPDDGRLVTQAYALLDSIQVAYSQFPQALSDYDVKYFDLARSIYSTLGSLRTALESVVKENQTPIAYVKGIASALQGFDISLRALLNLDYESLVEYEKAQASETDVLLEPVVDDSEIGCDN